MSGARRNVVGMSSNAVTLQYVHVTVDDVDQAIAFYRDALGFDVAMDVGGGEQRWVTLGVPAQPGLSIVLSPPAAGRSPEDAEAMARLLAKGVLPMVVFATNDLDATFERAVEAGAEVLQEPKQQDWGPRDAAFRDPAGNQVRVSQAA